MIPIQIPDGSSIAGWVDTVIDPPLGFLAAEVCAKFAYEDGLLAWSEEEGWRYNPEHPSITAVRPAGFALAVNERFALQCWLTDAWRQAIVRVAEGASMGDLEVIRSLLAIGPDVDWAGPEPTD